MDMKFIHLSNSQYIDFFKDAPLLSGVPYEVVDCIENQYFDMDIFVINLNYKDENIYRSQNYGIQVLKLLRLKNYNQHCIVYSFLSKEQLLEINAHNLILHSQGITFVQLPFDFTKLDFEQLKTKVAPNDLSAYFEAESILPDNRHFFANWWGVWQLWQVQKAAENIAGVEKSDQIAKKFGNAYKEMSSYQGLLARYLKGHRYNDIAQKLKEKENERRNYIDIEINNRSKIDDAINELTAQIEEKDKELRILKNLLEEIKKQTEEIQKQPIKKFLTSLLRWFNSEIKTNNIVVENVTKIEKQIELSREKIKRHTDLIELIGEINKEKERIYEGIRAQNRELNRLIEQQQSSRSHLSYNTIKSQLQIQKPSIVYVDDQANEGWAFIFKRIIYGDGADSSSFNVIVPNKSDDDEQIAKEIYSRVKEQKAKLLILDLRLKGEVGTITDPSKISGINVLKYLNKMYLPCPILITTASNKAWTYNEAFKFGATAFWIKEGLDQECKINDAIDNYFAFIDLVYILYNDLNINILYGKLLPKTVDIMEAKSLFWWETKFWKNPKGMNFKKTEAGNRGKIVSIILNTITIYRNFITTRIKEGNTLTLNQNEVTAIISSLHSVIEHIYAIEIDNKKNTPISEAIRILTSDKNLKNILDIRNKAMHNSSIDQEKMIKYASEVLNFLQNGEYEYYDESDRCTKNNIKSESQSECGDDVDKQYTDIVENKNEPERGKEYRTIIKSIHNDKVHIYLKNPGLNLKNQRTDIMLHVDNIAEGKEHLVEWKETACSEMEVLFNLRIKQGENKQDENYYAYNAKIIKS